MSLQKSKAERSKKNYLNCLVLKNGCCNCGKNDFSSSLTFHHVVPSEKRLKMNTAYKTGWVHVMKEIPKTAVICANCHNEFESGQRLIDFTGKLCGFIQETLDVNPEWRKSYERGIKGSNKCQNTNVVNAMKI